MKLFTLLLPMGLVLIFMTLIILKDLIKKIIFNEKEIKELKSKIFEIELHLKLDK